MWVGVDTGGIQITEGTALADNRCPEASFCQREARYLSRYYGLESQLWPFDDRLATAGEDSSGIMLADRPRLLRSASLLAEAAAVHIIPIYPGTCHTQFDDDDDNE